MFHAGQYRWQFSTKDLDPKKKFALFKIKPVFLSKSQNIKREFHFPIKKYSRTLKRNQNGEDEVVALTRPRYFNSGKFGKLNFLDHFETVFYVHPLDEEHYTELTMEIDPNQSMISGNTARGLLKDHLDEIQVSSVTGNTEFYGYITGVKMVFCLLSIVALVLFYQKYSMIPEDMVIVEQRIALQLGWLLVIYNDPLYWVFLYSPNTLNVLLTAIGSNCFYYCLIYYWLVVSERMYRENSQKSTASD